jgi:para-nitrobenzyl esterase
VSPAVAAVIAGEYPLSSYSSPAVALGAVGTDAIFACPALTVDQSLSAYVPTYAYEFNDENAPELFLPPVTGFSYGAAHASELQYLFGLRATFPAALSPPQQHLAAAMKRHWTNLARRGSPGSSWPRFDSTSQQVLSLVPPRPQVETGFAAEHHCAFWALAG